MNRRDIEAIYPLTEMQQGFLVRHLRDPNQDDGFLEVRARIEGRIDLARFTEAWARVVARHEVLRSSIHWPNGKEPLRIVHGELALPPLSLEEGGRPPDRSHPIDHPVPDQPSAGPDPAGHSDVPTPPGLPTPSSLSVSPTGRFALRRPPTWHIRLLREGENGITFVWTCHHVLVDGWSAGVILDDLVSGYNHLAGTLQDDRPRPPAYASYLRWLRSRDREAAQRYWAERFDGFVPRLLAEAGGSRTAPPRETLKGALDAESTRRLIETGRSVGVPIGTLVQAAWALALARGTGASDVCFGLTVSGRPADIPGIQSMAGMFMSALPLRVRIDPARGISEWLQSVQSDMQGAMDHGFAGPATLQAWANISGTFFDSLLVFENYRPSSPDEASPLDPDTLRLRHFESGLAVGVPVTLGVLPGERLQFELRYDASRIPSPLALLLHGAVRIALEHLSHTPAGPVSDLLEAMPPHELGRHPAEDPGSAAMLRLPPEEESAEAAPPVDAPTTTTELRLSLIIAEVLSAPLPALDDDFFALGGDSMSALRLLGRLEEEFGRAPSVETFLARPTVRGLADVLQDERTLESFESEAGRGPSPSLVLLSRGGTGRPVYFIHAGGGHILFYYELARRLGTERPVYALQAVGLDGREPPLRTVEAMAERYLEEIRTVQSHGPYALAGLCFGNLVALEIARKLADRGEIVEPLIMLDSAPYHLAGMPAPKRGPLGPVVNLLLRIARGEWSYLAARLQTLRRGQWTQTIPPPSLDETNLRTLALSKVLMAIREAEERYRPLPYRGSVLLVRTTEMARRRDKDFHESSWRRLALGGLSVERVEGGHMTMFERPEEIDRLAAVLRAALRSAGPGEED